MAISFVNDAKWGETNDDTSYLIQKPTGIQSGDLMIAILAMDLYNDGGDETTISPPSGWTKIQDTSSPPNLQHAIMTRTATSTEPNSWNGSLSGSRGPKQSITVAYRGVTSIATTEENTRGSGTSVSTGSVTNPAPTSWRIVLASYVAHNANQLTSNEVIKRETGSSGTIECGAWDSNGTIAAGSTSRTVSLGETWESVATWIAILSATDTSVPGTLGITLSLPSVDVFMDQFYEAELDADALLPTMTASGIATPPDGPLEVVVMPVVAMTGSQHSAGTLDVVPTPSVDVVGETRKFGIRVVTPEAESRVTRPQLGAVD
jgi:hypothetical protein